MHEIPTTRLQREAYLPAYLLQYPKRILFISYVVFLLSGSIFYIIWKLAYQRNPFPGITLEELSGITVLVYALAEYLHMLIQRGMSRLFGYRIAFDFSQILTPPQTYTGEPGQYQSRGKVLLIAVAPLVLLVFLWLPLLLGLQGANGDILADFLCVNVSRSLGDIYFIWRVLRLPKPTVIYTLNAKHKLILERNR